MVHGCRGVPFPHFERFGSSKPRKPDSTDLVPSKAVIEEHGSIIIDVLRSEKVNYPPFERRDLDLTLKSSRKSRAGSNPGLLSTLENLICCPVSTPGISTDAFSYERGSVDASRWMIKSYSVVGCAFRICCWGQLISHLFHRKETHRDIIETVGVSLESVPCSLGKYRDSPRNYRIRPTARPHLATRVLGCPNDPRPRKSGGPL